MSESDNNQGYLTPSKLSGPNAPKYGGRIIIDGQKYWVSGWKNTGNDGVEFITLRLKKNDSNKIKRVNKMPRKEI